uniref:SDR family NAD(P)-dependent oxidoreductase n=1 Tax=Faecalicatena contorta TaxID=39482 RepID=UPI00359C7409
MNIEFEVYPETSRNVCSVGRAVEKPQNKVCLITGATSGIGLETAKQFLKNGYRTAVCSNDTQAVAEAAMSVFEPMGDVVFYQTDISEEEQCEAVVAATVKQYGRLDVLVNAAGITEKHLFLEGALDEVKRVIDIDLLGTLCMCKYGAQQMVKQNSGVIINITSMCSVLVNDATVGYHTAKAGVMRATQVLAKELAPNHVRCVSVAPAWVNTRLVKPETAEAGGLLHLRRKIIEPQEIADVVYYLAQDEAAAVNGSQVMADDGYCEFKVIE